MMKPLPIFEVALKEIGFGPLSLARAFTRKNCRTLLFRGIIGMGGVGPHFATFQNTVRGFIPPAEDGT